MNKEAVYQAFLDLPRDSDAWTDPKVKALADDLMLRAVLAPFMDLNRSREAKGGAHQRQLHLLAKASRKLIDVIDALSRTALEQMEDREDSPRHPVLIRKDLEELILFLAKHDGDTEFVNKSPGRYSGKSSPIICNSAMRSLEAITGQKPKITVTLDHRADGRALNFLKAVFLALDITSSPESQLRAWIAKEKKEVK